MNVGQRVLLIATWHESECVPPPIGAIGFVSGPLDCDGDYFVLFDDFPCPHGEPDWFTPSWAIVPIDRHKTANRASVTVSEGRTP
jgi:hypothetical protein